MDSKKMFIGACALAVLFIGFLAFSAMNRPVFAASTSVPAAIAPATAGCGPQGCGGMALGSPNLKEFVVVAKRFSFEPATLSVQKGDRVRLTLKSADVAHGLAISEYGVDLRAGAGGQNTVEFTADKEGTFNFACSVYCGGGHLEMGGKLVVGGGASAPAAQAAPAVQPQLQVVKLYAAPSGYDQNTLQVRAGQPVRLEFSADPNAGCGRQLIIDNVGVNLISRNGETVSATFTPPSPGVYRYHCSMNMFRGQLVAS